MLTVLRKLFGLAEPAPPRAGAVEPALAEPGAPAAARRSGPGAGRAAPGGDLDVAAAPADADAGDAQGALRVNVYATCSTLPTPDFPHALHGRRGLDDPELRTHLQGFAGYVMAQGDGRMTPTRLHVLRHLARVQQHLSLTLHPGAQERFAAWCRAANALAFTADGSVRDPEGRRLVGHGDGACDEGAEVPYPEEALRRRHRTTELLAARGLRVMPGLPPRDGESELRLRTPEEVFGRAAALAVAAVRAESARDRDLLPADVLRERLPVAFEHLSPAERAFLADDAPTPAAIARFGWGYEGQAVLQWALGLDAALPFPDRICDAAAITATMLATGDAPPARFALRPPGELLDELDLCYRLHWIARQARQDGQPAPAGFSEDVVQERHRALNWLVCAGDAPWDEVDTPT
jgi:hypothetical protein